MKSVDRRAFLLAAAAAAPLAACGPTAMAAGQSAAPRRGTGLLVRAGQDHANAPRTVFGGLRIDGKVPPAATGGDLYVIEHSDHAKGGPPRHVHHAQDEWFYVLEGSYVLMVGDERYDLAPGDSVLAPRAVPHVWAHTGEGTGRLIIMFQPAGGMESFLTALSRAGSEPSPEVLRPLFSAHGMTVVGPPLPV